MYDKTDFKELKKVCTMLNEMEEVTEQIKLIGTKKDAICEWFIATVEKLDEDGIVLDEAIIAFYNDGLIKNEVEEEENEDGLDENDYGNPTDDSKDEVEKEEVTDVPPEGKKGKGRPKGPAKEPKPKKEKVVKEKVDKPKKEYELSPLGSRKGSQAYDIDLMVVTGLTLKDAAAKLDTTPSRVHSHIKHLITKGFSIPSKDGVYKLVK